MKTLTSGHAFRKASRTLENLEAGDIKLGEEDLTELNNIVSNHQAKGDRYYGSAEMESFLWG